MIQIYEFRFLRFNLWINQRSPETVTHILKISRLSLIEGLRDEAIKGCCNLIPMNIKTFFNILFCYNLMSDHIKVTFRDLIFKCWWCWMGVHVYLDLDRTWTGWVTSGLYPENIQTTFFRQWTVKKDYDTKNQEQEWNRGENILAP